MDAGQPALRMQQKIAEFPPRATTAAGGRLPVGDIRSAAVAIGRCHGETGLSHRADVRQVVAHEGHGFALDAERNAGKPPREAIYQACLLRFRPIIMTTMAAVLGALPLMIGSGAGSELRHPLGISIVGGLLVSQLLTLFTTPVIYLWFDRLALRFAGRADEVGEASGSR